MSTYSESPCNFVYQVTSIEKIIDGDTIDVTLDLGFDVCTRQRVRLLGIDTPESRTRDLEEKKKGLAAKAFTKDLLENLINDKDLIINNLIQAFAPDNIHEAKNRGFKPF